VNFSRRKYLTGLNVMKRTKRGCKNCGTVHWTKTRKKQRQLQGLYVGTYPCPALHLTFHYLRVQLLCSHYEIEMQGQMQRRSNNDSSSCLWLYYLFISFGPYGCVCRRPPHMESDFSSDAPTGRGLSRENICTGPCR
jgi:hypothetical protein